MKTLRETIQLVEPPGAVASALGLAHLLGAQPPISVRQLLDQHARFRRIVVAPLMFMQQNMALLSELKLPVFNTGPSLYKGTEREKAVHTLVDYLRTVQPDVVGLSECWVDKEKEHIWNTVSDIYVDKREGPNEADLEAHDGGLLLLSKHPIVDSHRTIYRQALGEDALTNKGALHARLAVSGHPSDYDVFLTHLQSPDPQVPLPDVGPGSTGQDKVMLQLLHLSAFVHAYSSPQRPALLMGDLNTDGLDADLYGELLIRLGFPADPPDDLRPITIGDRKPITADDCGSFESEQGRGIDDPKRYQQGKRLDYFISWHDFLWPVYINTQVLVLQSTPGARDISDHYGLTTQQTCVREIDVDIGQTISGVTVALTGFRCLTETGGPVPVGSEKVGSDEVEFELQYIAATGATATGRSQRLGGVDSGSARDFDHPVTLGLGDPGDALSIQVHGWEIDQGPFGIITGRTLLGPEMIHIDRRELVNWKGRSVVRVLPLLQGDGGEYAVLVNITVT